MTDGERGWAGNKAKEARRPRESLNGHAEGEEERKAAETSTCGPHRGKDDTLRCVVRSTKRAHGAHSDRRQAASRGGAGAAPVGSVKRG